jgi:hypothetical protein
MANANYLIIFSKEDSFSDSILFGFKLFDNKESCQFMKCVNLLANEDASFEFNNITYSYNSDEFIKIKLTSSDLKTLNKVFDFSYEKNSLGIFPDAINDAYDLDLIDENNYYEDDDYENENE